MFLKQLKVIFWDHLTHQKSRWKMSELSEYLLCDSYLPRGLILISQQKASGEWAKGPDSRTSLTFGELKPGSRPAVSVSHCSVTVDTVPLIRLCTHSDLSPGPVTINLI